MKSHNKTFVFIKLFQLAEAIADVWAKINAQPQPQQQYYKQDNHQQQYYEQDSHQQQYYNKNY
jgi:hypothetical protein